MTTEELIKNINVESNKVLNLTDLKNDETFKHGITNLNAQIKAFKNANDKCEKLNQIYYYFNEIINYLNKYTYSELVSYGIENIGYLITIKGNKDN